MLKKLLACTAMLFIFCSQVNGGERDRRQLAETVTFYASFDYDADADSATGSSARIPGGKETAFCPGACGQALEVQGYEKPPLGYRLNKNFSIQKGTISLWCKLNPKPHPNWKDYRYLFSLDGTGFYLFISPTDTLMYAVKSSVGTDDGWQYSPTADVSKWNPGEWHHVALTWDAASGERVLYVDGAESGRIKSVMEYTGLCQSFSLGARERGISPLNGAIDEFAIWSQALNAEEVKFMHELGARGETLGTAVLKAGQPYARELPELFSESAKWIAESPDAAVAGWQTETTSASFIANEQGGKTSSWTQDCRVDLSDDLLLGIWTNVGQGTEGVSLSFLSGKGEYRQDLPCLPGWRRHCLMRDGFRVIGEPAGWDKIDHARITVKKGSVQARELTASSDTFDWMKDAPKTVSFPRNPDGILLQNRVIIDEAGTYQTTAPDKLLDPFLRAGFNIYMPCVWHGHGARYKNTKSPIEKKYAALENDPMADMLVAAHAKGMQVHGWWCVMLNRDNAFKEFAGEGSMNKIMEAQNPAFRDFIVKEIVDATAAYGFDGVFLDFIRTAGFSKSKVAREEYRKKYGTDFAEIEGENLTPEMQRRKLEWQAEAVSDIVRRVSEGVRKINPNITITTYGPPLGSLDELNWQGRNPHIWVEKGWVDVALVAQYDRFVDTSIIDRAKLYSKYPERFCYILGNYDYVLSKDGKAAARPGQLVAKTIDYALRKYPEWGTALYFSNYLSEEQITALRNGPFNEKALPFYWGETERR
jgi:hypothetical protein